MRCCLFPTQGVLRVQSIGKDDLDETEESAYWRRRYTLRPGLASGSHDVPSFLAPLKYLVLETGPPLPGPQLCTRFQAALPPALFQMEPSSPLYCPHTYFIMLIHLGNSHSSVCILYFQVLPYVAQAST